MKKSFPNLRRQLEILGFQVLLGCCAQTAVQAGTGYIPGYYGNTASILPPAATALPTNASVISGINGIDTIGSSMRVHQNASKAVIHWGSFDIGSNASVTFDQPSSSSKILNRITGDSPSQIYGNLIANGQVYIINQNGILFDKGSQINVHSLTASALNIKFDKDLAQYTNLADYDKQFLTLSSFYDGGTEAYKLDTRLPYTADTAVSNHGTITAGNLGSVFLIGPQVENNGTITAEGGDVGLLAGDQVSLNQNTYGVFKFSVAGDTVSGAATNYAEGRIITDKGSSFMYGKVINQQGLIRATTALAKNGRIELVGTQKVTTGAASITETPVTSSPDRTIIEDENQFNKGVIDVLSKEGSVYHYGQINNPSGTVNIEAKDRIYLDGSSTIDVSGTWVELTAADRTVIVTLNSKELADAFAYKDGPLQGETVEVDIVTGLDFANISGYLSSMAKSAAMLTTKGGNINLRTTGDNGEIIVKEEALLDFSGGGLIYGEGLIASTKVRIGNKIYDLQDVPSGVAIDEVLGSYSKTFERYGLTDSYDGLYYGGSAPYLSYLSAFTQGSDAGTLWLNSRKIVLDGTMNASVLRGIYQNLDEEDKDEDGSLLTIGRRVPRAGTLQIGETQNNQLINISVDAVVIKDEVTPTLVTAEEALPDYEATLDTTNTSRMSEISAEVINNASIGKLLLYPNQFITLEEDAHLVFAELGSVNFQSQQIDLQGSIRIPSGTVDLVLQSIYSDDSAKVSNITDRIFLAKDSIINVSGEILNNASAVTKQKFQNAITFNGDEDDPQQVNKGGVVTIRDENSDKDDEIILAAGGTINANGGYVINGDLSLSGGNAGTISLKADRVQSAGTLTGLALEKMAGGWLEIHTESITIATSAPSLSADFHFDTELPEEMQGHLIVADNTYTDSGFSHLTFKSISNLEVQEGVHLAPSAARFAESALSTTGYDTDTQALVTVAAEYFGASSLTLEAGQGLAGHASTTTGDVTIAAGGSLSVAPADGSISVKGETVNLAGTLIASGGDINLYATSSNLKLYSTARVDASGTTLTDWENSSLLLGLNQSVIDGGTVVLRGNNVTLEEGSVVDISGSEKVTNTSRNQKGEIVTTTLASDAGSVDIHYGNSFTNKAQFLGDVAFSWLSGGSYTETIPSLSTLSIQEERVAKCIANGFTNFTFSSLGAINFIESVQDTDTIFSLAAADSLNLNASSLLGSDNQTIQLQAPWIVLSNVLEKTLSNSNSDLTIASIVSGTANLTIDSDFIDIKGNIGLSGFGQTSLVANQSLRLEDYYYSVPEGYYNINTINNYSGALRTTGDLTIQAGVIYPAIHHLVGDSENNPVVRPSSFTLSTGSANNITILPSNQYSSGDIYSAGGTLTLQAGDIDVYGTLAAPMGKIILNAENSVYLHQGSTLSTHGNTMVLYGKLVDEQWTVGGYLDDNADQATEPSVTAAPESSVAINADTITQAKGSVIDVAGGGTIFSYQFLPGLAGTNNPLTASGRYVILPDNVVTLPGETVYLEGTAGLPAGTYSLLPVEYAFLPGAIIIEAIGDSILTGETYKTALNYTVVAGYLSNRSTTAAKPLREGFIIRTAREVLDTEGYFDTSKHTAGNAGSVTINAGSGASVIAGSIFGDALSGYNGGSLFLSATNLFMGNVASLTEDVISSYNLVFDIEALRNRGLRKLTIGSETSTETIVIGKDSKVDNIAQVEMVADEKITLESNAHVTALTNDAGDAGTLSVDTDTLYGNADSQLRASDNLTLKVSNFSDDTYQGAFKVDAGTFQLNSPTIFLEPSNYGGTRAHTGAYLSAAMLSSFKDMNRVVLNSSGDIFFLGSVNFATDGDLTLDASRVAATSASEVQVSSGGTLTLQNTGADSTPSSDATEHTTLSMTANTIVFDGTADLLFDTFFSTDAETSAISLHSNAETIFKGTDASLTTDLASGQQISFAASRYIADATKTISTYIDDNGSEVPLLTLTPCDFTIDAENGDLLIMGSYGSENSNLIALPGNLTVKAENIILESATFNMPGGALSFEANDSLTSTNTAILARGSILNSPITIGDAVYDNKISLEGGVVSMVAISGTLSIDTDSTIDTSATSDSERGGGTVNLVAAKTETGGIELAGSILGDQLYYDTSTLGDPTGLLTSYDSLAAIIARGGGDNFGLLVNLRARKDNIEMNNLSGHDYSVRTNTFILTADQGAIDINGTIDVSGGNGGSVEIWAANELTLASSGKIMANGKDSTGNGGSVFLSSSSDTGGITTNTDHQIDVSGGESGKGGTVSFRASRKAISDNLLELHDNLIQGASDSIVFAYKTYFDNIISDTDIPTYRDDISDWYSSYLTGSTTATVTDLATSLKSQGINLTPEIEVRSTNDMDITGGLSGIYNDLTLQLPTGILPGILTFRAAGNLNVTANIKDAPHTTAVAGNTRDSWGLNFISGADLNSSALMSVLSSDRITADGLGGNFNIGTPESGLGYIVYTESGDIQFASANDTTIYSVAYNNPNLNMLGTSYYNIASFDGNISGIAGHDLTLNGGVIQTAVSDITIRAGNDIIIKENDNQPGDYGGIRTIGRASNKDEVAIFNELNNMVTGDYANSLIIHFLNADGEEIKTATAASYINSYWKKRTTQSNTNKMYWLYKDGGNISLSSKNNINNEFTSNNDYYIDYSDLSASETIVNLSTRIEEIVRTNNRISYLTGKNTDDLSDNEKNEIDELLTYFPDLLNNTNFFSDQLNNTYGSKYVASYTPSQFGAYYEASNSDTRRNLGITTMAGGNITIKGQSITAQVGAFGPGEVDIYAKESLAGRFLAVDGDISLITLGNLKGIENNISYAPLIELGSGSLLTQALGSVFIGAINNPLLTSLDETWNLSYSTDSSITINSVFGDVAVSGDNSYIDSIDVLRNTILPGTLKISAARTIDLVSETPFYLTPSAYGQLQLIAGSNINAKSGATSNYRNSGVIMSAADPLSVYGDQSYAYQLDVDFRSLLMYGITSSSPLHINDSDPVLITTAGDIINFSISSPKQTIIKALGDIKEVNYWGQNLHEDDISLISAGGDILQQPYNGNNYTYEQGLIRIFQSGKGALLVQANGSIDLGSTEGIQSKGNVIGLNSASNLNTALFDESDKDEYGLYKGADITVISGYAFDTISNENINAIDVVMDKYAATLQAGEDLTSGVSLDLADRQRIEEYLTELKRYKSLLQSYAVMVADSGKTKDANKALTAVVSQYYELLNLFSQHYSALMATGAEDDQREAARLKSDILAAIINPLLADNQSGTGDILMTQSVIKTTSGQDNLSLLAAGRVDVGTTTISDDKDTSLGLLTEAGGAINVFAENDINVNESRVVTFFGGDIFLLSNHGDINAGRGSITEISTADDAYTEVAGKRIKIIKAPIPGSGIRTLSSDPDGSGPIGEPEQGQATLIAWEGVIDAGEAGISASNVTLAATKILNAENISFSEAGVGVPVTADAGPSLNALTGSTTVSDTQSATQSIGQQVTDSGKKLAESVSKMAEDLSIKMLVFKFEGFGGDSGSTTE